MHRFLEDDFARERSLACFMISNILRGTQDQKDAVFSNRLIKPIVDLLKWSEDYSVSKQAAWVLCDILKMGNLDHVECVFLNHFSRVMLVFSAV